MCLTSGEKCSLTIDKALPEDEGRYTCRAENADGKAECSCMVTVDGKHHHLNFILKHEFGSLGLTSKSCENDNCNVTFHRISLDPSDPSADKKNRKSSSATPTTESEFKA